MDNLPDAPWIREAETIGYGDDPPICPVCGSACEEIYYTKDGSEPIACDRCLITKDAYEWQYENKGD